MTVPSERQVGQDVEPRRSQGTRQVAWNAWLQERTCLSPPDAVGMSSRQMEQVVVADGAGGAGGVSGASGASGAGGAVGADASSCSDSSDASLEDDVPKVSSEGCMCFSFENSKNLELVQLARTHRKCQFLWRGVKEASIEDAQLLESHAAPPCRVRDCFSGNGTSLHRPTGERSRRADDVPLQQSVEREDLRPRGAQRRPRRGGVDPETNC